LAANLAGAGVPPVSFTLNRRHRAGGMRMNSGTQKISKFPDPIYPPISHWFSEGPGIGPKKRPKGNL